MNAPMASEIKDQMLRYHMAVVTSDKRLRREIKRVTAATNSTADFLDIASKLESGNKPDLVIFDARQKAPSSKLLSALPRDIAISYVVEGDGLFDRVDLLGDERVESILAHEDRLDDGEFIASATKSLGHDVFGLYKYFPWGVTIFSMTVKNYEDKTEAIGIVMQYAEASGMRGSVRERIQLVCDELMMNALYHAPVDEKGRERYRDKPRKELARLTEVDPIHVQYGCSGRYFGISVRDEFGSLTRTKILDYLTRVSQGVGANIESKTTGAGLGIVSVAQSVSKLVFNIIPGVCTEVIALFDTDLMSRGKVGARSVHLFMTSSGKGPADAAPASSDDAGKKREVPRMAPRPAPALPWLVFAALLSIATAMGIAYLFTRSQTAEQATIAVTAEPPDAIIRVNGEPIDGSEQVPLPDTDTYELSVEKRGHRTWQRIFTSAEVRGNLRLYVNLSPEQ